MAFENTRHLPNVIVVWADLLDVPIPRESVDIVTSLGIIPLFGCLLNGLLNKFVYIGSYHNMYDAYTAGITHFHAQEEVTSWMMENFIWGHVQSLQSGTALYCSGQKFKSLPEKNAIYSAEGKQTTLEESHI